MLRYFAFCLLVALTAGPAHAQEEAAPVKATDLLRVRELGSVTVSPDQRHVAYTVKQIVETPGQEDQQYAYRTHIYLATAGGREPAYPLTRGERSAWAPAWHPDGDRLAFVRDVKGTPQVFVLPLFGGEAYQLTEAPYGATSPVWSPDGTKVLFASPLPEHAVREQSGDVPSWPAERPGGRRRPSEATPNPDGSLAEIRAWLEKNQKQNQARVFTRLDLQGERDLEATPTYRHLFVQEADPSTDPVPLTSGFSSYEGGSWGPGSETVFFSGAARSESHPDRLRDSDLFRVRLAEGTPSRVLSMPSYALSSPHVSPSGDHVAFLARSLDNPGYAQTEVGLYALNEDSEPRLLTDDLDRSARNLQWDTSGWYLFFTAPSKGGFPLYRLAAFGPRPVQPADSLALTDSLTTAAPAADSLTLASDTSAASDTLLATQRSPVLKQVTSDTTGVRSFDVSKASLFYVRTQVTNPYELYVATIAGTSPRRLTTHNASWLEEKRLSQMEHHTLTRDTLTIDYWTMKPAFYEDGSSYPMLLQIHGGPMAMWGPGEATMWHELQFFASQGYGIVFANPRGSGGYGQAFKRLNYQDWGEGPAGDVLAAASEAVQQPWLDADRQVITGGSYAGYLTAWIIAHDDRFQAAAAQRGVYDLATFLGEGNAWRLVPYHFGGYPWENEGETAGEGGLPAPTGAAATSPHAILSRNSPLTYVDQIDTPLLILHGDEDLRTGVAQSEMLYKSLKILGKSVEYVRYPNAGHDLSRAGDPTQRIDRLLRIYTFFERFIDHRESTASAGR